MVSILGALAFALAGFKVPGRKGFVAFIPAFAMLATEGESAALTVAACGCGILAFLYPSNFLSQIAGAGVLALVPAILPWINMEKGSGPSLLLAFTFSLFLAEGAKRMKGAYPGNERWFALACFLIVVSFAWWMWTTFLSGGYPLQPAAWVPVALLNCALIAGGWHKRKPGAEVLTLTALMGVWFLAI